jgi:cell division protein FtsB
MERRKKENMSLAKQNSTLEQENTVLKSRVEELEKMLGTD